MNRKVLWVAGSVGIFVLGAVLLRGQQPAVEPAATTPQRVITADGSATLVGKVDGARVFLGVTTFGKTVDAARDENVRVVKKVREAIIALKLDGLKSRTTGTTVHIQHENRNSGQELGFNVSHSFTIVVKDSDPEKLSISAGSILDAGLKNGVNVDGDIHFFKENDTDLQREAMSKAVEEALANAKAHAAGAKVKILGVTEIDGRDNYNMSGGMMGMQGGGGMVFGKADSTAAIAGQWPVSRSVRVVCRY